MNWKLLLYRRLSGRSSGRTSGYISQQFQPEDARKRFLSFVPGDTNVVCLEETARMVP